MDQAPRYEHTQVGPIFWLLIGFAAVFGALALGDSPAARYFSFPLALFALLAAGFRSLTVRDAGDRLELRFGPLPIFTKSIPYASMQRVELSRSTLIDGWGIHWIPGRGWIWNLWGFDCVRIELPGGALRIGTDDPEGLEGFLRERLAG